MRWRIGSVRSLWLSATSISLIESLAKRDRRELESRLDVLLNHLLKRCYIPTPENYRGWELTIREQRKELQRLLKQSPSLRSYLSEIFDEVWKVALAEVREDYPEINFPDHWKFRGDTEAILSEEFWSSHNWNLLPNFSNNTSGAIKISKIENCLKLLRRTI